MMTSCAHGQETRIDLWCLSDFPIKPSHKDNMTADTERQIKDHNDKGELVCGWQNNLDLANAVKDRG